MATIVLFDIDGTLLNSHGAGKRALERAFAATHGIEDAFAGVDFAGRTDPAIVRSALERAQLAVTEARQTELIEAYLGYLGEELDGGRVERLPGVLELLDELSTWPELALGLGTGNVAAGARRKLRAAGIDPDRFAFGGFGDDAEDRARMLEVGAQRGSRHITRAREECTVWVIGDTPRDVAAAQAIGARSIGVGTGPYEPAALAASGADRTTESLLDPEVVEALRHGRR